VQGPWSAPRIYPEVAGILENPEAAYAKLRELGAWLFGMNPGQSGVPAALPPQTIDALIDRLGDDRKTVPTPANTERQPSSPTPLPLPRPQPPQAQARPQPQPPPTPPAQSSSQSQSSSQPPSLLRDGPIGFFKGLFGQ